LNIKKLKKLLKSAFNGLGSPLLNFLSCYCKKIKNMYSNEGGSGMISCSKCKRLVTQEHSFVSVLEAIYYHSNLFPDAYCASCRYEGTESFLESKRKIDDVLALEQQARDAEKKRIDELYKTHGHWAGVILSLEELGKQNREIRKMCGSYLRKEAALPWP